MVFKILCSGRHEKKTPSDDVTWFLRKRNYLVFLLFCGMVINVLLRTNLSIAMVEMTSSEIITIGNVTHIQKPEFEWTSVEKGLILSSFSWGYFLSPIGGFLSKRYGGVTVFGVGVLITTLFTALSPVLVRLNTILFMIGRTIEGAAEGSAISGAVDIFVHWTPENEKSRAAGISGSGFSFGATMAYPICGFTAGLFGWRVMFLITSGISLLWIIIWFIFVSDDPDTDKFISKKEKLYLSKNVVSPLTKKITYPWKSIFTSAAVWAFLNERFLSCFLVSFTVYCIPLYIKDVNNVTIENIGLISSVPNFGSFLGTVVASFALDYIRNNEILTVSNAHKLFLIGTKMMSIVIISTMIVWTDFKVSIICLSLFRFCYSLSDPSNVVLPLDLSPHHASILVGISSTAACIGYIVNPILLGLIVQNHTVTEWNMYFAVLCVCNIWGIFIFFLFGSGKQQPWAIQTESKSTNSEENHTEEIILENSFKM